MLEGHNKNSCKKHDPKVKCLLVTKRERCDKYLYQKGKLTPKRVFKLFDKKQFAQTKHTQIKVQERIASIITTPTLHGQNGKECRSSPF